MTLEAIATQNYETVRPDTRAGKLRSTLSEETTSAVLVVGPDGVEGAVLPRDLLRSRVSDDAEARSVVRSVPKLAWGTPVREVARQLVENDTTVAPIVDDGDLHGVVTRDSLLRAVSADLSELAVTDVHTQEPVTVGRSETMGAVINTLREHGISRLPVVDDGDLVGVATTSDLVEFVVRGTDTASTGDRGGENTTLLDLPVADVMSRPAETVAPDTTIESALRTMFEYDDDGLVVVEEGTLVAVITKTDVLRALTYTAESHLDVQVTNPDLLRDTGREDVAERIEEIASKFQELDVIHAHVTFQKHEEQHRGESLIRSQVRLFTDETQLAGTGEGYGAETALSIALDKLERNVLELKGKRSPDERQEQVLATLQDLP